MPLDNQGISRLAKRSGGVPRVLTILVDAAAFLAATDGAARIDASHIDQAAAMRGDDAVADAPALQAEPDRRRADINVSLAADAPPVQPEPDSAMLPGIAADRQAPPPAVQAAGRRPGRNRAAALYAAAGVVQIRVTRGTWKPLVGAALATFDVTHKPPVLNHATDGSLSALPRRP